MHRTTTTATLLVTVAVSALTGCVTVQQPPAYGPPPAPPQPSAPGPNDRAEPQIVEAPAREALELIGPSRRPKPAASPPHRPAAVTPSQAPQAQSPRSHPEPRRPQPPRVEVPDVTREVPKNATDLCALGKKYGNWQPDSPQAVICKEAYGR